jgi:hypothetical protein
MNKRHKQTQRTNINKKKEKEMKQPNKINEINENNKPVATARVGELAFERQWTKDEENKHRKQNKHKQRKRKEINEKITKHKHKPVVAARVGVGGLVFERPDAFFSRAALEFEAGAVSKLINKKKSWTFCVLCLTCYLICLFGCVLLSLFLCFTKK